MYAESTPKREQSLFPWGTCACNQRNSLALSDHWGTYLWFCRPGFFDMLCEFSGPPHDHDPHCNNLGKCHRPVSRQPPNRSMLFDSWLHLQSGNACMKASDHFARFARWQFCNSLTEMLGLWPMLSAHIVALWEMSSNFSNLAFHFHNTPMFETSGCHLKFQNPGSLPCRTLAEGKCQFVARRLLVPVIAPRAPRSTVPESLMLWHLWGCFAPLAMRSWTGFFPLFSLLQWQSRLATVWKAQT